MSSSTTLLPTHHEHNEEKELDEEISDLNPVKPLGTASLSAKSRTKRGGSGRQIVLPPPPAAATQQSNGSLKTRTPGSKDVILPMETLSAPPPIPDSAAIIENESGLTGNGQKPITAR
jgi:hypothetical protein